VIVLDQLTKTADPAHVFQLNDSHTVTSFFFNVVAGGTTPAPRFRFLAGAAGWQALAVRGGLGVTAGLGSSSGCCAAHAGQRLFSWALALILGGPPPRQNVIDRLLHGYVVDFIPGALRETRTSRRSTSQTARSRSGRGIPNPRRVAAESARAK